MRRTSCQNFTGQKVRGGGERQPTKYKKFRTKKPDRVFTRSGLKEFIMLFS